MADQPMSVETIKETLGNFQDPETGRKMLQQGQLTDISVDDSGISLTLGLTSHSAPLKEVVSDEVEQLLRAQFPQAASLQIKPTEFQRPPQKVGQTSLMAKSVIAVGSGKGGVGKSTVSTSLAFALKNAGCKVGLMDADVYGPSIPMMTGMDGGIEQFDGKMLPKNHDGMKLMSIGFLVPPNEAVIWRGPMLHSAMGNFLNDTNWGELDYLLIDMPPGTGDVALSISQLLPLTGAVVVCTPQDVALADAVKSVTMFRKVEIPVLGLVENMSGFICPGCEKEYDIFGKGGARQYAEGEQIPFLGDVPIHMDIRESGDAGKVASTLEHSVVGPRFEKIALQLASTLRQQAASNPVMPQLNVLG